MDNLTENKSVVLKDKREIRLKDENGLSLSIILDRETIFEFMINYPCAGYGGGEILLSPDDKYLLFSYYSGQSEEAFILFNIEFGLEIIYDSGYLVGEVASYGFSNDGKQLIQGLPRICSDWWELVEDFEEDENGVQFIKFGYLNILDIGKRKFNKNTICIYMSESWQLQKKTYSPVMSPKISNNTLKIQMSWGEETIDFPLKETIIFRL